MKKFAVLGLGQFAMTIAGKLAKNGAEVIVVDRDEDMVDQMKDVVSLALKMDSTDHEALMAQGIHKADAAIVGMGDNFEMSVLTTFALKHLGVKYIIAKVSNEIHGRILSQIGADEVIWPEEESAIRLANRLLKPTIIDSLELAEGHSIAQVTVPQRLTGKTLREIDPRNKYKVNIVAVKRAVPGKKEQYKINDVPSADNVLQEGDVLFVAGADKDIADFSRRK